MINDSNSPCELILKIGCNEYDEISTAITSLFRLCSINDEKFFFLENQIQPTTYFGTFTNQLLNPIQCQSISCVIFLTDEFFQEQKKTSNFFKSINFWNFHHKIELINEYKQIIARQDYYELSKYLPLWSISHIPYNKQIIIRFNIFTKNFDFMLKFYQDLFQRKPDSSKIGFVLFNLSKKENEKYLYQFSIKYSSSIQSYTISQSTYLKFRLNNLNNFLHEYTRKLFLINKSEYYIYDPDGNLLHLYLNNISTNINEYNILLHTNDSGFGDSSESSKKIFYSNLSNDSGQCSSISSNEIQIIKHKINNISVRSAKKSEIDYRLKQQEYKSLLYDSEPRLSNIKYSNNRYYSSMNNIQKFNYSDEISYEVDSPSSYGYLNAFLLKKQNIKTLTSRPKSAPSIDQIQNSRINIGITLDSRLRKTPVFDMLRSSTMQSEQLNRKYSFKQIARF